MLAIALAALTGTSHAQDPDHHAHELDRVVVRATPLPTTAEELTRPVEVLGGEALDEARASTLGATVAKLPGVQSSMFGAGVGRPIVRGFEGARVQVLSDGLGAGDISTVSVDHGVSIEPFLADQIEVLKGPATLLYGSGAIGGAVNVIDGRIPERRLERAFEGRAELRAGSVDDERAGLMRLDAQASGLPLVFHVDALHRETGDYSIPGFARSEAARSQSDAGPWGAVPNTATRTDAAALGVSWVGGDRFAGLSQSLFNTRYGIPGSGHAEDEEAVTIRLDQRRAEVRAGRDGWGPFTSIRGKLARTDYTHTEFEGDEVGTVFDNDTVEGRVELVHGALAGVDGALGVQGSRRRFAAIGEEAFVPSSATNDAGLFWIGRKALGPVRAEIGARADRTRIDVDPATAIGPSRAFDTRSLSLAGSWQLDDAFHVSLGLDRAQRAPTAEELYSAGEHVATRSFELGDPGLGVETANRVEAGLHWHAGPLKVGLSAYHVRYSDFIFLATTDIPAELPVRRWAQADARFTGGELEAGWTFFDGDAGRLTLHAFADRVRARLAGRELRDVTLDVPLEPGVETFQTTLDLSGNLPRIAPARIGGELRGERGPWRAALGAVRTLRQDDVAPDESPTPGYTLVDANLTWHADVSTGTTVELYAKATNLLDVEARVHTSFLKDYAPLPGRGVALGVRVFF
ncbi:MAG: TonB-dependent receptor [Pseudomonadota bacterium]